MSTSALPLTGDSRLSVWLRVRCFAVPPTMIETATARRLAGDWAGACAAAGFDTDLDVRAAARRYGSEFAGQLRADLRHLAPDLLRWHMPRIAPDGLLRPGLTLSLARYGIPGRAATAAVHLVVRTPPAWADAPQRISLALWDPARPAAGSPRAHPHPRPARRFRLDLHRHLWDARRAGELRMRSGADRPPDGGSWDAQPVGVDAAVRDVVPAHCAVDRWAAEAAIVLRAEQRQPGPGAAAVRFGTRRHLVVEVGADGRGTVTVRRPAGELPVLPHAAVWTLPDLALLRAELIEAGQLHPLVAAALAPDGAGIRTDPAPAPAPVAPGQPRYVECRGARHRIALVDGILAPLDHAPDEIRREELLAALSGTPLPCLRVIDEAHRRPDCLPDVRARLDHGDTAGALAVVEALLGPGAALRNGALRDALETAARRRVDHGLYRAGLAGPGPYRGGPYGLRRGGPRPRPAHSARNWAR